MNSDVVCLGEGVSTNREDSRSLQEIGVRFYRRGWCDATSGNYSLVQRRDPLTLLLTASGGSKGFLAPDDFVLVGRDAKALEGCVKKPSAETRLHVVVAMATDANAILHTHSIWGTLISDVHKDDGRVEFSGYEMLKGLSGVLTHEDRVEIAVFSNTQDMDALGMEVAARLEEGDPSLRYGFLIHHHGLYTWGKTLAEAERQIEALEFLFEVSLRKLSIP